MEARVLRWQELAKGRASSTSELESFRLESIKREEEQRNAEKTKQLIDKVPQRFRGKIFDDFYIENKEQARIKLLAERYVETFKERLKTGSNLLFLGKPGTGKTLLSLIMYQSLAKAGYQVQYESSTEFLKSLLEIKFKSQALFQMEMLSLQRIQFLIIDEITESINKDGVLSLMEKQLLFNIINERYEKQLCTIIISNRDKQSLADRLSLQMIDRLSEKSISLAFNWNSYRQKHG